jgi:hypothetical protein
VQQAVEGPNPFDAYLCPYDGNRTLGTVISNAGDRLVYHTHQSTRGDANNHYARSNARDTALRGAFNNSGHQIDAMWAPGDYRWSRRYTLESMGPPEASVMKDLIRFF